MRHVAAQQGFNTKKSRDVAQRKEILKEFGVLFPHPPPDFQALYHNIALDARTSPSTAWQEVVATYEKLLLDNASYGKKGNFLKKSVWYCIISSGGLGRDVAGGGGQGGGARPWSASGPWVSANSSRISCCAVAMPEPITCRARIRPMDHGK